jgi:hypothetical protein
MSAFSWLSLRSRSSRTRVERRRRCKRSASNFVPGVCGLEERTLLATVATDTNDSGPWGAYPPGRACLGLGLESRAR